MDYIYNNSLSDTKTTIGLMAAKGKEEFYKKFGFIERPNDHQGPGMIQIISK
ncbi:hypothetical protein [Clostridium bornimense]|uniref:hypothetical protein n=1 Tax=Clostridium bornimense TaxID=1216932 RepID=UPI0020A0839F|nr:hypothetical protein [Clostridium bornimense]